VSAKSPPEQWRAQRGCDKEREPKEPCDGERLPGGFFRWLIEHFVCNLTVALSVRRLLPTEPALEGALAGVWSQKPEQRVRNRASLQLLRLAMLKW
jgi:hypothetical protein